MSDPAALARVRRWRVLHWKRMRELRRAEARKRNRARMREYDRAYRAANREARNLARRSGVSVNVARRWLVEGRVPPYKRPGWAARQGVISQRP